MKRVVLVLLYISILFLVTACALDKQVLDSEVATEESETSTESEVIFEEPTIEETLGVSAIDISSKVEPYNYQKFSFQYSYKLKVFANNRVQTHYIQSTILYEADENFAHEVTTIRDTVNDEVNSLSKISYMSIPDGMCYTNENYNGWVYGGYNSSDNHYNQSLVGSSFISAEYSSIDDNRVSVSGSAVGLSDIHQDNFIKQILSKYGVSDCTYTFNSYYDLSSYVQFMDIYVDDIEECMYGEYPASIENFNVTISCIECNNDDVVTIPEYVYGNSSTPTQDTVEQ